MNTHKYIYIYRNDHDIIYTTHLVLYVTIKYIIYSIILKHLNM